MSELMYIQVYLADGKTGAWSSLRGRLEAGAGAWREVFGRIRPETPEAKVMIHFIGDDEAVTDEERLLLMEKSKRAGFNVTRIQTGAPLNPEEAFELLMLPFT